MYTCEGGGGGVGALEALGSAVFFFFFPPVAISDAFRFCALVGCVARLSGLSPPNGFFCVPIQVRKVYLGSSKRSCETIATSTNSLANALNWNRFLILWTSPSRTSSAASPQVESGKCVVAHYPPKMPTRHPKHGRKRTSAHQLAVQGVGVTQIGGLDLPRQLNIWDALF